MENARDGVRGVWIVSGERGECPGWCPGIVGSVRERGGAQDGVRGMWIVSGERGECSGWCPGSVDSVRGAWRVHGMVSREC